MSNKLELQNNNIDLQGILTKVNTLPKKENIDEEVDTIENLTEQIKLALEGKAAGGEKVFAAIGVTYPEGSTCTCTNGTKTMEAGNTNGQWVFAIPETETGTWTVTSSDPTDSFKTKSKTVEIIEEGQFETVALLYQLIIFSAETGLAKDYTFSNSYLNPSIDVTNYNTLEVSAKLNWAAYTTDVRIGLHPNTNASATNLPAAYSVFSTDIVTNTIDLTELNGEMYLGFWIGSAFSHFDEIIEEEDRTLYLKQGAATGKVYSIILK